MTRVHETYSQHVYKRSVPNSPFTNVLAQGGERFQRACRRQCRFTSCVEQSWLSTVGVLRRDILRENKLECYYNNTWFMTSTHVSNNNTTYTFQHIDFCVRK